MSNNLSSSTYIRKIIKEFGFKFTKSLGQNFLKDEDTVYDIVNLAELTKEDVVIEVGPGIGVMTDVIAQYAGKVVAIEIDQKLIPILEKTLAHHDNIIIVNEDILKIDLEKLKQEYFPDREPKIIANLPYYITTPIIMMFLESDFDFDSMIVMMQKEVAERIASKSGNKVYGALSVAVQYYTEAVTLLEVPKGAFIPEPNVSSMVLKLTPYKEPVVELKNQKMFFRTVKAAFSTRRKTLLNSLSNDFPKNMVKEALEIAQIDPGLRAEKLNMNEFAQLSNAFEQLKKTP